MCLAVPGQIVEIAGGDEPLMRMGRVRFGGITKEINLAYTPEAGPGDYVLVHVGFALTVIDEREAKRVFDYLKEIDEIEVGEPPDQATDPARLQASRSEGRQE